jgi:twitching motility protein PilT
LVDAFPAHQQSQVRAQVSLCLEGILCQSLLPKASGSGRVLIMEIMIPNPAIRNLIREDKIHQLYSSMQTGQQRHGMQTFNQALATAYFKKQISLEMAINSSSNVEELKEMIERGAGLIESAEPVGGSDRNPKIRYT